MHFFALVLAGLVGLLLGLLGSGGSIVTLPVLVYVASIPVNQAVGMTLVIVGGTSALGSLLHLRRGDFDWRTAAFFSISGMVGAFVGAKFTHLVSAPMLIFLFGALMLVIGIRLLRNGEAKAVAHECRPERWLAIGVAVSVLTGFLGVGGGFLILPALALFAGLEMKPAIGTSLAIIAVNCVGGLVGQLRYVNFDWRLMLGFLLAAIAGMFVGAALAKQLSAAVLRRGLAWCVVVLGLRFGCAKFAAAGRLALNELQGFQTDARQIVCNFSGLVAENYSDLSVWLQTALLGYKFVIPDKVSGHGGFALRIQKQNNSKDIMKNITTPLNLRMTAMVLAGALALAGSALAEDIAKDKPSGPSVNVPLDETSVPRDGLPRGSFAPVVKMVAPAVVQIETTAALHNDSTQQFPGGAPFGHRFPHGQFGPQTEHGLGSGVIVTKDGYILTNNHVVDGAKEVKVTLQDGREFTAKVVGRDPKSDVAVVKIAASDLPVVAMADSEKVQIGDVVLAVGNPFGVGQTVTSGIVSATDRGDVGIEDYEDFIQTDAAINPGNSGGALVDIDGRLIGINTAIMSRSGGSQGMGFAIPSDLARTVMEDLIKDGHVTRGYLGVMIQNITTALAGDFKLKDNKGALIGDVLPGGPADKAGFKDGDVVVKFNGHAVIDSRRLRLEVAETKPGTAVPVEVLRNGDMQKFEVTVKPLPGGAQVAEGGSSNNPDTGTLNGVDVGDLDQATREQFHVPNEVKGAIVTQVESGSPAAEAGLKPGDVIEEINRHPVKNADEAVQLTEKTTSKQTLVRVWENGGSHYLVVDESSKAG